MYLKTNKQTNSTTQNTPDPQINHLKKCKTMVPGNKGLNSSFRTATFLYRFKKKKILKYIKL